MNYKKLSFVKITPNKKFENGRFAKISIRENVENAVSRKLVLAKCDFFDLAKINPLKVLFDLELLSEVKLLLEFVLEFLLEVKLLLDVKLLIEVEMLLQV